MALFQVLICCFTAFALIITSLTATASTITKPPRFVSKLIHNYTVESAIESSAARFAYLNSRLAVGNTSDDFRSGVIPDKIYHAYFLANISIGEPPVPQLLIMDTGSNLLWTQCLPCTKSSCFPQNFPVFDPSKSSTYATMPCMSPSCHIFPGSSINTPCDSSNTCKFSENYVDGSSAAGVIATEKLTFETSDEGTTSVSDIAFGCANNNHVSNFNGQSSGIVGLGYGNGYDKVSLATQLGSKFSYCLGPIRDPQYPHNQLILGDGAQIEGPSTPVEFFRGFYFLTLDGISVGEKELDIDPQIFRRSTKTGKGGVLIDSGTTDTYLTRAGFEPLSTEVQRLAANAMLQRMDRPDFEAPCYKGVMSRDLVGFPPVAFHFAGGVDLVLDSESMFFAAGPNQFCMAVVPSKPDDVSVIGVLAQQNYNIGYDLDAETISFQRIDCELLET